MDALARQEGGVTFEVVVVLDGDVDGSRAILEARPGTSTSQTPTLEVVELSENCGRSIALNAGFDNARGDVLIRCDDDLVPGHDYVARHVQLHQGPAAGVVGLYRNVFPETAYARVYGRAWDQRFRDQAYAAPPDQTWRYWAGNCSVTRRTWDAVGPYDPAFRAYGYEDVDWGYRLAATGVPIILDPQLETEHRIAATTTAVRAQRAFYSGAARRHFEAKHRVTGSSARSGGIWDRAVGALAKRLDEKRIGHLGSAVDACAGPLPDRVAEKAVAMLVEAAARSGHARGQTSGAI